MPFDLNSTLLLIIIFQFTFLGLFLLTHKKGKRVSNVVLGVLWLTIAISLFEMLVTLQGTIHHLILFSFIDLVLMLIYGPLIFFYSKSVLYKDFRLGYRSLIHFIPFLIFLVLNIINYQLTSEQQKLDALERIYTYQLSFAQAMIVVPFYCHILLYIFLSFQHIKKYKKTLFENYSNPKPYSVSWLLFLIRSFVVITLLSLMLSIFPYTQLSELTGYVLGIDIILTFYVINQIVFKALKRPELFSGIEEKQKYEKSTLNQHDKQTGLELLNNIMLEKKPYLDASLTLNALSEMIHVKERDLSQIINELLGSSFHDFINEQRINYAKELMRKPPDPKMTILEILYASGFNSKSSFNTAFKKHTGTTPTEFRKQNK